MVLGVKAMDKRHSKATLIIILVGLVLLFSLQNARLVEVNFLFWSFQMSRIFLILIVFGFGFLAGFFAADYNKRKKK